MLGAFDIKYMPRIAVKGQVLVDLVVEFIEDAVEGEMLDFEILVVFTPYSLA